VSGHFFVLCSAGAMFLLSNIGCHHPSKKLEDAIPPDGETELVDEPVVLEIENHNWSDIVIYVLVEGKRYRFLNVRAAKDVSAELPRSHQGTMGMLRFALHRIGSPDEYVTEQISLRTGKTVRLTVESELHRSSIAVF